MKTLKDSLQANARNNAWSNMVLYEACLQLTQEEFTAPRTSFFPTLQLTLNHILLVDQFYFDALRGGMIGVRFFEKDVVHETAADLWNAQSQLDRDLALFCDTLTEDKMNAEVRINRGSRGIVTETVAPTLSHMFLHQAHHRGQAHAMLSGTRIKPPQLDDFYLKADARIRESDLKKLNLSWPNTNPLL